MGLAVVLDVPGGRAHDRLTLAAMAGKASRAARSGEE